jgi:hypothetical protein
MNDFPKPNEFAPEKARGRDFMGQQATIQALTGDCLPTFTNSTAKLRYYSFWAWAYKMLSKHGSGLEGIKANQYLWKLETALNIANWLRDPEYTGMPGVKSVEFPDADFPDIQEVKIDYGKDYRTSAYSPVQYAPSLGTLSIVQRDGGQYYLLKFGIRLAEIYDGIINKHAGYTRLIHPDSESLSMGELKSLIPALSLENVSQEEKDCFLEVIEQNEVNTGIEEGMTPRIQTTRMLLDIIRTQKAKTTEDTVTPVWNGSYKSPTALRSITDAWRIVRARQFFQLSVESYLSAFSLFIEGQPSRTGTLVAFRDTLINWLEKGEVLGFTMKGIESKFQDSKTLWQLCDYLNGFCLNNGIDEDKIMKAIQSRRVSKSHAYQIHFSAEIAALGFILQILLYYRVGVFQKYSDKRSQKFLAYPQGYRLSFNSYQKLFQRCMEKNLREGLDELLSEAMLKLHLGVAQDKWLQTGNFTFRFVRADDGGYMRQFDSDIYNPNATGNKLWAFISILRYIGFWDYGDDKQMILTQDGLDYLAQAVPLND